ncbi:MAG: hypothetical protein JWM64_846, partial [Frankiales bacterium]|nr:hypothetical protein [Frankiales bacterium]
MPSASLPDPSDRPAPEEGEVVEVFVGDSLEEAMAAAVEALGPGLEVRRARKVRAGVRGLLGRDRYEVLAVPGADAATLDAFEEDPVGSALDALLDAADARESGTPLPLRPAAARPAAPRPTPRRAAP